MRGPESLPGPRKLTISGHNRNGRKPILFHREAANSSSENSGEGIHVPYTRQRFGQGFRVRGPRAFGSSPSSQPRPRSRYLGELMYGGFNFAPHRLVVRAMAVILAISQNTALFSLLGTNYGGNGTIELRPAQPAAGLGNRRVQGQGPGLSPSLRRSDRRQSERNGAYLQYAVAYPRRQHRQRQYHRQQRYRQQRRPGRACAGQYRTQPGLQQPPRRMSPSAPRQPSPESPA